MWRKNESKMRVTFSTHKQNFPLKLPFWGVQYIKVVCYCMYVSLRRYDVVVKAIKNGRREVKSSLVRK